jgi:heme iron utilization protein
MASPEKIHAITLARRLLYEAGQAALATAQRNEAAWPYPSFVLIAADVDGAPLLFISGLAEHTRNLQTDPRAGLLLQGEGDPQEPLAGARLSLLGTIRPAHTSERLGRFLARHPSTERLTALGDFALHRMEATRAHLIAGFGRARWLDAAELLGEAP